MLPTPVVEKMLLPESMQANLLTMVKMFQSNRGFLSLNCIFPYQEIELLGRFKASWTLRPDDEIFIQWEFRGTYLNKEIFLYGDETI
ncbi:hypothetical protein [Desulfurobacterium sp.]